MLEIYKVKLVNQYNIHKAELLKGAKLNILILRSLKTAQFKRNSLVLLLKRFLLNASRERLAENLSQYISHANRLDLQSSLRSLLAQWLAC